MQRVKITEFDRENWRLRARLVGDQFSSQKHPQLGEVKAITYSAMQIYEGPKPELFVIVDV